MPNELIQTEYSEIMQKSYIDYAMSVIVARALPDVRDGLKPVQRRTLYDMYELGIRYDKPYRKSARIVGDTMGKYHPHGDSSIYGALVVLAQDFKMGVPLVDGHGNFGSIEGDGAAAMRYTEARLQRISQEAFLSDLDKNVVDFVPNFDENEKEPSVLPARIPNILVNGSEGIAVGMATSIPPHNLGELIDALVAMIRDSSISDEKILEIVKGPDFPTGGIVVNKDDLPEIYKSGSGRIRIRGKVEIEKIPRTDRQRLVVSEIPYTMIGAGIGKFLNDVAALADSKAGGEISDISNQSSKEGIRIVIELRKGADAEYIKRLLYKKTKLEDTFSVNMLAVSQGRPETFSLREILENHIDFQFEIATRKYRTLLDGELNRKEIEEGLIRAVDVIDLIIEILRGSKDRKMAKECLVEGKTEGIRFKSEKSKRAAAKLRFTDAQATAILEMRLYKLIGLEIDALTAEYNETLKNIEKYTDYLNNYSSMAKLIISELLSYKKRYAKERKTLIENAGEIVLEERTAAAIPSVFLMDRFGYARMVDETVYEKNKESADSENRFVLRCMSDARLLIFTDAGRMHSLRCSDLHHGRYRDKGTPIDNICNYDSSKESVTEVMNSDDIVNGSLIFVTEQGFVKQVPGTEFIASKRTISATKLSDDDRLISVHLVHFQASLVLVSSGRYLLRLSEDDIPVQKKGTKGVKGMKLSESEKLEAVYYIEDGSSTEVQIWEKTVSLSKLHISARGARGSKLRK